MDLSRSIMLQGSARAVGLAFQIVHFAIAARLLAPDAFGALVAALAVYGIASALSEFGLLQTTVLALSEKPAAESAILRAAMGASLQLGLLTAVVAAVFVVTLLPGSVELPALLLLPAFVVMRVQLPFAASRQHRLEFRRLAVAEVAGRATAALALLPFLGLMLSAPADLVAIAMTLAAGAVVTLAIQYRSISAGRWSWVLSGKLLLRSARLGMTYALSFLHVRVDQILLAAFRRPRALATYGVAYRVLDGVLAVVTAVGVVALPTLASTPEPARPHAARELERFLVALSVVLGITAFVFAPQLVVAVGGERYREAAWLARLLTPALVVSVLNLGAAQVAIVQDKVSSLLAISGVTVVANIVLNVALIPTYGARGSAVATVLTEFGGAVAVFTVAARALPRGVRASCPAVALGGFLIATFGSRLAWDHLGLVAATVACILGLVVAASMVVGSRRARVTS